MRINRITNNFITNRYNFYKNEQPQTKTPEYHTNPSDVFANYPTPFLGSQRVDKSMVRFYDFNEKRLPTTVKMYLETVDNKYSLTPLEAQRNAFADLYTAENIEDVQKLFPEEELFIYLNPIEKTKANSGILGIYREYKELYPEGILNNGDDFTVYLLRKIFAEAKTLKEINEDLDNDLNPDIKDVFKHRYKDNDYIKSSTLKSLGIYTADVSYQNSLKFTREGYSDTFGLKISEGLLKRWDSLSEEEKTEMLTKRCQGRDNWWNNLSYDEKLELATGVDAEDDLYKDYRKYTNANRKKQKEKSDENLPEFENPKPEPPKKKIKVGSNINDKDLFVLWMKRNLDKFYSGLSEDEKEVINIKRSKRLAQRWQEMSPAEKTEYINKIRINSEPIKYAMIDTWNHSRVLIRALSEYLKEQQILKPVDMLYTNSEFSEFQSRIMTEFWASHKDLAADFGKTLKYSHQKVEDAIKSGEFEKLKIKIEQERKERIKILEKEFQSQTIETKIAEEQKIKEKEEKIPPEDLKFRKEFTELYKKSADKYDILPRAYTQGMAEIMLDRFPKDILTRYAQALKDKTSVPLDVMNYITNEQNKNDCPEAEKLQRTLEAAIAVEMTSKGANPVFFEMRVDSLIPLLNKRYNDTTVPKAKKINPERITKLFNEYNRGLNDDEMNDIANKYFLSVEDRNLTREENDEFEKYLNTYGRTLLILFSDKSAFSDDAKIHFANKFNKLMSSKMKEYVRCTIERPEDIYEENEIKNLKYKIYKRLNYIPDEILKIYTGELAVAVRVDRDTHEQDRLEDYKKIFTEKSQLEKGQAFPHIVKTVLSKDEKIKMLAMEEALADEFYRVTKNEDAYSKEFEHLTNFFDMLSLMKREHKSIELCNEEGSIMYLVKEKPNTKNLHFKYRKYLNIIKSNEKDIFDSDGKVNKDELLYCLNPAEDNPERDENIMKRIDKYFIE